MAGSPGFSWAGSTGANRPTRARIAAFRIGYGPPAEDDGFRHGGVEPNSAQIRTDNRANLPHPAIVSLCLPKECNHAQHQSGSVFSSAGRVRIAQLCRRMEKELQ